MGYRSEIVIAVHKDAVDSFETTCAELIKLADEKSQFVEYRTEGTFYCWNSVKWYEDFSGVQDYYHWANVTDSVLYSFIRLGEDADDVEHGGHLDCGMHVERTITVPSRI